MAQKGRRSTRALVDLPGLFDEINTTINFPDPLSAGAKGHAVSAESDIEMHIDSLQHSAPAMLQFLSLGSGSSGNCSYLGVKGRGGLLIDAGVPVDKVLEMLKTNGIPAAGIRGILITHDHSDHVRYVYPLLRKLSDRQHMLPVYCTPRTMAGILRRHTISRRITDHHKPIFHEFPFEAGPFAAISFEVSHDGSDNSGYCLSYGERNFVFSGDLGTVTERADYYMRRANYLMIESDYDAAMLATGTYPEHLKARIQRPTGHLSNWAASTYVARIWQPHLSHVFLCHLSVENNRPELALRTCLETLANKGIKAVDGDNANSSGLVDLRVSVLPRFEASPLHLFRL